MNIIASSSKQWCQLVPVMIRVCRKTPIMGLITLLCAGRDWCLTLAVFSLRVCLCWEPCAGAEHTGELWGSSSGQRFLGKGWFWGSAGSAAEGQPSTRQDGCGERSSCPTFRGAHGLCVEQDFSPWTLLSVNGTNSLKSLLLPRFPSSLYLLIRLFD